MPETDFFSILNTVDSTNNYAMAAIHEGLAKHEMAWFAKEQTAGKGQRGKIWYGRANQNIALSVVLQPASHFTSNHFMLNALITVVCHQFFASKAGQEIYIKWPNDIYWRDRKAGGILIENIMSDKKWKWSVIGIGVNINQTRFGPTIGNVTSLAKITDMEWDPIQLGRELYEAIVSAHKNFNIKQFKKIMEYYNTHLFRKNELVKLKKDNIQFSTTVKMVNNFGQLLTEDVMERQFTFGEVEWVR